MKLTGISHFNKGTLRSALLYLWLAGCACGAVYGALAGGEVFEQSAANIRDSMDQKLSFATLAASGGQLRLEMWLALCVASSLVMLIPITLLGTAFLGFAPGFTSALIIRCYGIRGILMSGLTVMFPALIYLPLYILLLSSAIRFPLESRKIQTRETVAEKNRKRVYFFAALFGGMFILWLLSLCEILWARIMIRIIGLGYI